MAKINTAKIAFLERKYTDLEGVVKNLISSPQLSPQEILEAYSTYSAILGETRNIPNLYERFQNNFEVLSTELRIRLTSDYLRHSMDFEALMVMLSPPYETAQLQWPQTPILIEAQIKKHPTQQAESVEAIASEYYSQAGIYDPDLIARIGQVNGNYIGVAQICEIAGYQPNSFYYRVRGHNLPKHGKVGQSVGYLINDETIPVIFGHTTVMRSQAYGNEANNGAEDKRDFITRIEPLKGTFVSAVDICEIAGYTSSAFYKRILGHALPKQGKTSQGVRYLINDETIPIIFGYTTAMQTQSYKNDAHQKNHAAAKDAGIEDRISKPIEQIPNTAGEILTYDQMLNYTKTKAGIQGDAILVKIMLEHGDYVQLGNDRFSKPKLDELIGTMIKKV